MTDFKPTDASPFPATSRYFQIEIGQYQSGPQAQPIAYVRRRFLPSPERFSPIGSYTVTEGDRLDNITAAFLGDPEQFWRVCDANNALSPSGLTATLGRVLQITLPEGVEGSTRA